MNVAEGLGDLIPMGRVRKFLVLLPDDVHLYGPIVAKVVAGHIDAGPDGPDPTFVVVMTDEITGRPLKFHGEGTTIRLQMFLVCAQHLWR